MHSHFSFLRFLFVVGIAAALTGGRGFAQTDKEGDSKTTDGASAAKTEAEK